MTASAAVPLDRAGLGLPHDPACPSPPISPAPTVPTPPTSAAASGRLLPLGSRDGQAPLRPLPSPVLPGRNPVARLGAGGLQATGPARTRVGCRLGAVRAAGRSDEPGGATPRGGRGGRDDPSAEPATPAAGGPATPDPDQPAHPTPSPGAPGPARPDPGPVEPSDPRPAHRPVLLDRVVDLVTGVAAGWFVDGTLGRAGHAAAVLARRPDLRLLGLDRDPEAIAASRLVLAPYVDRTVLVRTRFDHLAEVAHERGATPVQAVLFDLGVSSPQLDRAERGFSYRQDAPLDMRMDPDQALTAAVVVNTYEVGRLASVLRRYGDERFAGRIAAAVVAARPLATTTQLAEVVRSAIPAPARRRGGHPATRTFQAIRIEVNGELDALAAALDEGLDLLAPGGRLVVLSYHSGEDRLVKAAFRRAETGGCTCPPGLPCVCGAVPLGRPVRRGGWTPDPAEVADNPRASSARLRAFAKAAA